ncbi:hypothetical protein GQ43DRAFT_99179 [Delitschia confertaspora ATCC 74209]|uniref:FAR-17a/AIG1-like protein n=1 Tax=Delitschia confertaspora ATCC 74209 TaxID=1513339 RepID=A0A9P4JIP0_9PLEO|nr:hypothetical protein GQ43DRAFT_99179 [Delitschia confertaspora ATCC 74209]
MRPLLNSRANEAGFDPTYRFETSWILPPGLLFAVRLILSLYSFVTLFTIFGYNGAHNRAPDSRITFSYFTNLTYWGLAFYLAFSALHSGSYWLKGRPFLAAWPRVFQEAHSIFYTTVVVYPWIVTIVFWALIYSNFVTPFQTWSNTSEHALNSVYAFFEIIFPRTAPPPFLHILPIIVILALYLGLAYLTYFKDHFFVYDFLDNKTHSPGLVTGYCFGILIGAIIVFLIVRYLIVMRVWITETKLGRHGKAVPNAGSPNANEDAEKGFVLSEACPS